MQDRPYQLECLENIRRADIEGRRRLLVLLPTGTGKTRVASRLPEVIGLAPWEQMCFIVHRQELAFQSLEDFRERNPHLRVTLEKAEHKADPDADIVVASVDTLALSARRLEKLAQHNFRVIFCDECHHSVSRKYLKVLTALRVLKDEPNCDPARLLVGLTATARRADSVALEKVFDEIVFRRPIRQMIDEGWLAEPVAHRVQTGVSLDGIGIRQGDLNATEQSKRLNALNLNALVVKKYLEFGAGLPFICFSTSIEHSNDLAATFRHHGLGCEAISANTPTAKRRDLVQAHRDLQLLGLVSCEALMEGFNSPPATVALWVRNTLSGLLYQQGCGRVMRPYPAKENAATHTGYVKKNAILVDFVGNSERLRLYTASVMYGLHPQFDFQGKSIRRTLEHLEDLSKQNPTLDITAYAGLADVEAAATRVDLWRPAPIPKLARSCSRFIWMAVAEDVYRLSAPGQAVFIELNHLGEYEVYSRANGQVTRTMKFLEPGDAFAYADALVPDDVVGLLLAKARWRSEPPTEPQCQHLWFRDPVVKRCFSDGPAFYRFARYQFERGNKAMSKGNLSLRIEMCKRRTGGKG